MNYEHNCLFFSYHVVCSTTYISLTIFIQRCQSEISINTCKHIQICVIQVCELFFNQVISRLPIALEYLTLINAIHKYIHIIRGGYRILLRGGTNTGAKRPEKFPSPKLLFGGQILELPRKAQGGLSPNFPLYLLLYMYIYKYQGGRKKSRIKTC